MSSGSGGRGLAPRIFLLALALFSSGSGLAAQGAPDPVLEGVREELEGLLPLNLRLGERARAAEEAQRASRLQEAEGQTETFSVGPFRVLSVPEQRELAEEVIRQAWDELRPLVDGSEGLLERWTFLVHSYWRQEDRIAIGDTLVRRIDMSRRFPRAYLDRKAVETIGNTLFAGMPPEVAAWAGGQPNVAPDRLSWVARELITTPSRAVRRCFRGELPWCLDAMAAHGTKGGWERWYSPDERRFYIQSRTGADGPRTKAIWEGCVEAGMDEACEVFLRDREPVIPLSTEARASLLGHVLRKGGPGAFQRLRAEGQGSLVERLSAAAGEPPDQFLASWRAEVLQAQSSASAGLAKSPFTAFLWVLLLGFFAVRSTRWRLG